MLRRLSAVVLIVGLFALGFVEIAPSIELGVAVEAKTVAVNPRDLQLVCPGSLYRSAADTGLKVGSFTQVGTASLSGTFAPNGAGSVTARDISGTVVGSQPSGTVAGPLTLTSSGLNLSQSSQLLNANQLQLVNDQRAAGLFAAPCLTTQGEHWLLGADTTTGRESLLVLTNPGSVNATVALELYGESGIITTAGQSGISVAAQSSTVLPIASLAPGLASLTIRVLASSSAVTATLQQKTVRGLVAAGGDFVSPSTVLAKSLVIPGVFVRGAKDAAKLATANADYADLKPTLRIFLPATASAAATVTAQAVGTSAKTFGTVVRQTVTPGTTVDVPLTGLQDGNYAVFISADQNIRAALRLSRTNLSQHPVTDFTWLQAAESITSNPVGLTVPNAGIDKLSIANPNKVAAIVKLTVNGAVQTISVPSQNSVVIETPKGAKLSLTSTQPVGAALVIDVNFTLANLGVVDYQNLGATLRVLVR